MIREFTYNVSALIQNRITGENYTLVHIYNSSIEIGETNWYAEFKLNDSTPLSYIQTELDQYCSDNYISYTDIDLIKIMVSSNDPDIVVYFENYGDDIIPIDRPIYVYIQNPQGYLNTPILQGIAKATSIIRWTWTEIAGCAYTLQDINGYTIAEVGVNVTSWDQYNLNPNTNYTVRIQAYNENSYSEWSEWITVSTSATIPVGDFDVFSPTIKETVELKPIPLSPLKNDLYKSGIGQGDDLLVSISPDKKEDFMCKLRVYGIDTNNQVLYPERMFQYRQKSITKVNRMSKFGNFSGDIKSHQPENYKFKASSYCSVPIDIQRKADVNLLVEGLTPTAIKVPYKYQVQAVAQDQPINIKDVFNFGLKAEYYTDYTFDYTVSGQIQIPDIANTSNNVTIQCAVAKTSTTAKVFDSANVYTKYKATLQVKLIFDVKEINVHVPAELGGPIVIGGAFNVQIPWTYTMTKTFSLDQTQSDMNYNILFDGKTLYSTIKSIIQSESFRNNLHNYVPSSYQDDPRYTYGVFDSDLRSIKLDTSNGNGFSIAIVDMSNNTVSGISSLPVSVNDSTRIAGTIQTWQYKAYTTVTTTNSIVTQIFNIDNNSVGHPLSITNLNLGNTDLIKDFSIKVSAIVNGSIKSSSKVIVPVANDGIVHGVDNWNPQWTNSLGAIIEDLQINSSVLYKTPTIQISRRKNIIPAQSYTYQNISKTFTYEKLSSMSLIKINTSTITDILKPLAGTNKLVDGSYQISTTSDAVNVCIQNEYVYASCKKDHPTKYVWTYKISPWPYVSDAVDGLCVVSQQDLIDKYMPKASSGTIIYDGTDYENITWTLVPIGGSSQILTSDYPNASIVWNNNPDQVEIKGLDDIYLYTSPATGTYECTNIYDGDVVTPLEEDSLVIAIPNDFDSYQLRYNGTDFIGRITEEDRIYSGDKSKITYKLTILISNGLSISWNKSSNMTTFYNTEDQDNINIVVNKYIAKYSKSYTIPKTISSEAGNGALLIDVDELNTYLPYYNDILWPLDTSTLTYTLRFQQPNVMQYFKNGGSSHIGPEEILANVNSNMVTFTAEKILSGVVYDYQCPLEVFDLSTLTPYDNNGNQYTGDPEVITYNTINATDNINLNTDGTNVFVDIINKSDPVLVQSINQWVRSIPAIISLDSNIMYSLTKTGGHINTFAAWGNLSQKCSIIGDTIYSNNGQLSIWAESDYIELDDITYSSWKVGIVNDGSKVDLTVPIDIFQGDTAGEVIYEVEIQDDVKDVIYTIDDYDITFSCNTTSSTPGILTDDTTHCEVVSELMTLDNNISVRTFTMAIPEPSIIMPDKTLIYTVDSDNPNIYMTMEDPKPSDDGLDMLVDVTASILIQSQTAWKPVLNPGYFYTNTSEHYLFAENNITIELIDNPDIEDIQYSVTPLPKMGSPIIIKDSNDLIYQEMIEGLEITEELTLINNQYLRLKYTGIDINSIYINDETDPSINVINNIVILPNGADNDKISIRYKVNNSFYVDEIEDNLIITVHGGDPESHSIYYETGDKYIADIDLNPLRSDQTCGFLYIKG